MTILKRMTAAYLAKFTKAHGFQRIQKEIVHCSNTLLSGSTMGARVRRKEMIAMIKLQAAIKVNIFVIILFFLFAAAL